MATLPQLKQALVGAHNAGDSDGARRLARIIKDEEARRAADPDSYFMIEGIDDYVVPGTVAQPETPGIGEKLKGVSEVALTVGTGATSGLAGMIGGTAKGIIEEMIAGEFGSREAAQRIEQQAMEAMQQFTYAPRTETGQELIELIGEVSEPLIAVAPMTAELGAASAAARNTARVANAAARERVLSPMAQRLEPVLEQIRARGRRGDTNDAASPTPEVETSLRRTPQPIELSEPIYGSKDPYVYHRSEAAPDVIANGMGLKRTEGGYEGDGVYFATDIEKTLEYVDGDYVYRVAKNDLFDNYGRYSDNNPTGKVEFGEDVTVDVPFVPPELLEVKIGNRWLPLVEEVSPPTPGTGTSAGAAAVDKATLRQAKADQLPVPITLTEGQRTRDFEAQRFERETAKLPEEGAPIRERFEKQNLQLQQNLDAFIDMTGAELTDLRGVGEIVDKALRSRAAKDKARIRALYKEAEKAGELEESVDTAPLIQVLNSLESAQSTAPVINAVKNELVRLGGAVKDADGRLIAKRTTETKSPNLQYLTQEDISELSNVSRADLISTLKQIEKDLRKAETEDDAWDIVEEAFYENQIQPPKSFELGIFTGDDGAGEFAISTKTANKLNEWLSETKKTAVKNELGKLTDEIRRDAARSRQEFPGSERFDPADYGGLAQRLPGDSGISLNDMEQLRKLINKVAGNDPTNIKFAADIKRVVDEATEGLGGNKYKQARAARAKYAKDYESIGLVKNLLGLKRGSADRSIALEDVLRKSILEPSASLDSVRQLRRLLQTKAGDEGKQAWKELQGATLRHIQDQMLKGVTTNQRGDRVVSPAQLDRVITNLDKTGKLDFIFGKQGAEQLRTINDVAKTVLTAPPGTVNTSNTATVLAGLMDVAISGTSGIPAPIMSSFHLMTKSIKDAKLRARVRQALGEE